MRFPGQTFVIVSSYALVNEVCNEKRFPKSIQALMVYINEFSNKIITSTF